MRGLIVGSWLTVTDEWKRGWAIVLTAAAGLSFLSVVMSGLGAFIEPLTAEFGWSRATLTMGMAIAGLVVLLFSPFAGSMVDRFGPRRLALPGVIIMTLATAAFSMASGSVVQWAGLWMFYAVAHVAMMMSIWTGAVARAFDQGRGLALGLTLAGSAVAQTVIPSLSTWLIDTVGWRQAYIFLGFGWGSITLLLCWLFLHEPRGTSRRESKKVAAVDPAQLQGLSIGQAWRDPGLWRIAISTLLLMLLTMALAVHQIPIMTEAGLSRETAALLAGISGLASIAGNVVTGALMDRYRANWVGGITLGIMALAFGLLLDGVRTPVLIFIAMMINGYSAGTKLQICGYLTSRYGGLKNYGAIFGFMGSLIAIGGALGPFLAGLAYDYTGSYNMFVIIGMIGCFLAGLLILTLPRCPEWDTAPSDRPKQDRAVLLEENV
jgi:predicted MFS family arabinose efflux permease